MTILLVHVTLLALVSLATGRRLVRDPVDRFLATAMLFWGNLVATCLVLSLLGRLNDPAWIFRGSLLLGVGGFLCARRFAPAPVEPPAPAAEPGARWLIGAAALTLLPMLGMNLAIAAAYEPNNYDTLTYHLPRVMYYLGHNSLAHFETEDFRQVYYPFNFNLLQLVVLAYWAPLQCVNFFDVAAWVVAGLAVYRIARLAGGSFNAALIAAWLALTSTEILAQATSTILDLPSAAALACALALGLRWRASGRTADALLAGLAASMSAGTKLTVAFFGPAGALLVGALLYQHWRRGESRRFWRATLAWTGPALLAAVLCAPFVLYNYVATGELMTHRMDFTLNKPFNFWCGLQTGYGYLVQIFCEPLGRYSFDLEWIQALNKWAEHHAFAGWNPAHAFSDVYLVPPDLNEDHVFYGWAGPLFLICGVICFWRDPRLRQPMSWLALLGLGWFLTYFATNKWSLYNQRYFVPAFVVLAPCAAAVWDTGRQQSWARRFPGRLVFAVVALSGLWFSLHYLVNNHIRPLPLPTADFVAPRIGPELPDALVERLPREKLVNVTSFGTNERIFPLMHLGPRQLFTSGTRIDPEKYSLFSFWGATRNTIYSNLAYFASYIVVPVPDKRTAGVEFLGTVPDSPDQFDYIGLPPHAGQTPATPATSNIAVLVHYNANTNDPIRIDGARVRIMGLNSADRAELRLSAELPDGTALPLLTAADSEWRYLSVKRPFKQLVFQVVSRDDGRNLGLAIMPFTARVNGAAVTPAGTPTIFASELIVADPPRNLAVTGLADIEGPYPQWDLPRFRWANKPVVRIEVPADSQRNRLRLTFTVRLHVRDAASYDLVHNGRTIKSFHFTGKLDWYTQTVEVAADPGVNVFEFKDLTPEAVPDWPAYLDNYPDVKAYVVTQGLDLAEGARQHYESHGRAEGRTLPLVPGTGAPRDSLYLAFRSLRVEGFTAR